MNEISQQRIHVMMLWTSPAIYMQGGTIKEQVSVTLLEAAGPVDMLVMLLTQLHPSANLIS